MSAPVPPEVLEIAAPVLFGTLWNWTLYGVLVVQTYVYSYNFPEDKKLLKLLVYAMFLFETLQTALSGVDLYYRFASGFGNMDRLRDPYVNAFDVPIMGAIVSETVQIFFAYRVWVLSNRKAWWYCIIIIVSSTVNTTSAFVGGIYAHVHRKFINGNTMRAITLAFSIGGTVSDLLIVAAMLFYLIRPGNFVGRHLRDHALVKIVRLTIETNIMTTTCVTLTLLLVIIFPHKFYYTCPTAILGKLYSNTFLVSLNNRISIREEMSGGVVLSTPATSQTLAVPDYKGPSNIMHVELKTFENPPLSFEVRNDINE